MTGSVLARLFPTLFSVVSENATTDDFNAAETEAVRIQAQIDAEPLTAMTTRATTAETRVTELEGKLTAAETDRDKYKAWHDKQSAGGTRLPGNDAATRSTDETVELSTASADALAMFKKRKLQA